MLRRFLAVSFVVCGACSQCVAENLCYEVHGTLVISNGVPQSKPVPLIQAFTVAVRETNWFIKLEPQTKPKPVAHKIAGFTYTEITPDYKLASSDGTHFYGVDSLASHQEEAKIANAGLGMRGDGAIPFGLQSDLLALWYAYVSGGYLSTNHEPLIYPLHPIGTEHYYGDFRVSAEWELSKVAPHLPTKLITRLPYDGTNLYISSMLSVSSQTNCLRMEFPLRSTVTYYHPGETRSNGVDHTAKPIEIRKISIIAVSVTNQCSVDSFVPELPGPSVVNDFAFRTSAQPAIVSQLTNTWPNTNQLLTPLPQ